MAYYPIEQHSLLRKSFVHLKGVGPRSERHLWQIGIKSWEQLRDAAPKIFKGKRLLDLQEALDESLEAWQQSDLYYFASAMPGNERWRLIAGGFEDIAYFDIEATDGGMPPNSESTAIAFYFRGKIYQEYEYHLKRELIEFILKESSMLCTYNGAAFDIPFLASEFQLDFRKAHIDLSPWYRRRGFKGGLKAIQRAMPHLHQRSSMDINGFDAIRLWRLHEQSMPGALNTLLAYNAEDAVILEPMLVDAYNAEVELRPDWGLERLVSRPAPCIQNEVDPEVYSCLKFMDQAQESKEFTEETVTRES
ncbi:MAG: ribonuclease H-like domain-containing protein [Proteobacteria bacterium]|nr:ribonuclease H-like domain-containing protein [Pseudomonadota bacterium]